MLPQQHGAGLERYTMALSEIREEPLLAAEAFPPEKLAAIEQLSVDPVSNIARACLPCLCAAAAAAVGSTDPTTASVPTADEVLPQLLSVHY